jgi:hypothetical protein
MSDVVEDEEENSSNPLAVAAFLSRSATMPVPPPGAGGRPTTCSGSLGFSNVDVLDKNVEPLSKGLGLEVRRHGGEEAAAPTRGCGG